jgi:hypothetical protein
VKFAAGIDKCNGTISGRSQYFSLGTIADFKSCCSWHMMEAVL